MKDEINRLNGSKLFRIHGDVRGLLGMLKIRIEVRFSWWYELQTFLKPDPTLMIKFNEVTLNCYSTKMPKVKGGRRAVVRRAEQPGKSAHWVSSKQKRPHEDEQGRKNTLFCMFSAHLELGQQLTFYQVQSEQSFKYYTEAHQASNIEMKFKMNKYLPLEPVFPW